METKTNVYQIITDTVINLIDDGNIDSLPWIKPWKDGVNPQNITGHVYTGINHFLMVLACRKFDYNYPLFVTFKQAKEAGTFIKKGEKGHIITFWRLMKFEKENEAGEKEVNTIPLLKCYTVFNLDQLNEIPKSAKKKIIEIDKLRVASVAVDPIESAENIISGYTDKPEIKHSMDDTQAYYKLTSDEINMPDQKLFKDQPSYYKVLFHELGHSTGHGKRLSRDMSGHKRTHAYSFEELIAEFTACFLSGVAGFDNGLSDNIENSAAYMKGWLQGLKDNPKWLVQASSKAQKASDYIQGIEKVYENAETKKAVNQ